MDEQQFEQVRAAMLPTDEELLEFFSSHHPTQGIMASMGHWAYKKGWFAHCGTGWPDQKGCGWESNPNTYETKELAHAAAMQHLVDEAKKKFFPN